MYCAAYSLPVLLLEFMVCNKSYLTLAIALWLPQLLNAFYCCTVLVCHLLNDVTVQEHQFQGSLELPSQFMYSGSTFTLLLGIFFLYLSWHIWKPYHCRVRALECDNPILKQNDFCSFFLIFSTCVETLRSIGTNIAVSSLLEQFSLSVTVKTQLCCTMMIMRLVGTGGFTLFSSRFALFSNLLQNCFTITDFTFFHVAQGSLAQRKFSGSVLSYHACVP